jgi:hypothetical protein
MKKKFVLNVQKQKAVLRRFSFTLALMKIAETLEIQFRSSTIRGVSNDTTCLPIFMKISQRLQELFEKDTNTFASAGQFNVTVPVASPNGETVKLQYRAPKRPPATSMKRYSNQTTIPNIHMLDRRTLWLKTRNVMQNDNKILLGI